MINFRCFYNSLYKQLITISVKLVWQLSLNSEIVCIPIITTWKYLNFLIRQFYDFTNNQTRNSTSRNHLRFNSFKFNKMLSHFMVNVKNQQPFRNHSLKHRNGKMFRKHFNFNSCFWRLETLNRASFLSLMKSITKKLSSFAPTTFFINLLWRINVLNVILFNFLLCNIILIY